MNHASSSLPVSATSWRLVGAILLAATLATGVPGAAAVEDPQAAPPGDSRPDDSLAPRVRETAPPPRPPRRQLDPTAPRGDGEERRPGRRMRDVEGGPGGEAWEERLLAVVRDVAPEWASRVEERLAADPEGTRRQLAQNGRRFMGLVALRERNPELYQLKVQEIRLQNEARVAAVAYHDALGAGDEGAIKAAEDRLRGVARRAVDANLKARGEELKALAEAVERFKEELLRDAQRIDEETDAMVEQLRERRPSLSPFEGDERAVPTAPGSPAPIGERRSRDRDDPQPRR